MCLRAWEGLATPASPASPALDKWTDEIVLQQQIRIRSQRRSDRLH